MHICNCGFALALPHFYLRVWDLGITSPSSCNLSSLMRMILTLGDSDLSNFLVFPDRALAEIHIMGEVQPDEGGGSTGVGQASHVRVRAVLALPRPPSQDLVRGRAVPARRLPYSGRKGGKQFFIFILLEAQTKKNSS